MARQKKNPKEPTKPKTRADYKYVRVSKMVGSKEDGTRKRIYGLGKNNREAQAKLDEAVRLYEQSLKGADLTVREWSERWKKSYKTTVSERQKAHYDAKLRLDILPVIGDVRMRDVTLEDLQSLIDAYSGGKKGTVEKIYQTIRLLFTDAEYEGIVERNPAARLKKPKVVKRTRRYLKPIERETLLQVAKTHKHGPYVLTILYTGMRRGEALALLRSDVDLEKKQISITKAIQLHKNQPTLAGTKTAEMIKSKSNETPEDDEETLGNRIVPIPDVLMPVLTEVCANKTNADILFPKSDGKYASMQTVIGWWRSVKRQCHIAAGAQMYRNAIKIETSPIDDNISLHYLRHTYSQDLLEAGVDNFVRASLLGHSTKDVTSQYSKMTDELLATSLEQINTYLNKKDT